METIDRNQTAFPVVASAEDAREVALSIKWNNQSFRVLPTDSDEWVAPEQYEEKPIASGVVITSRNA